VAEWTTPALARPRLPARSAFVPSRRTVAIAAAVLAALGLAYLAARTTPLFAIETVEVRGAPPRVATDVESAVARFLGTSLVALDGDELIRRVEGLPAVVSAHYDRAFPHTLKIFVVPEQPVALVTYGDGRWVVSRRGRVMRRADEGETRAYPRIKFDLARAPIPGAVLEHAALVEPLGALAAVPENFPVRIRTARLAEGELTLVLATGSELQLGQPADLDLKLAAATRVLSALSADERAALTYLDVSLPERPVAASNPQVVG
jgi:cell division protein FtsQ